MKRNIVWLLVLSLCLSMAACKAAGADPTTAATVEPTTAPTVAPTDTPTQEPTQAATAEGTEVPTEIPTEVPTELPTAAPTEAPTTAPTTEPTEAPTTAPTEDLSDPNAIRLDTAQNVIDALNASAATSFKLGNDVTIELADKPVRVNHTVVLDLNGHTLTINQSAVGNAISVEGGNGDTIFTIMDSSAAQTGTLRVVVTENGGGRDMFRINMVGGHANHVIVLGGNYEFIAANGVTPNTTLRFFNITNGYQTATIMGGTFTGHEVVQMHNSTSASNSVKPSILSGSFCVDPTDYIAEGSVVTQSGNMYIVEIDTSIPDDPSGGETTEPVVYVEVTAAQELMDAFYSPFDGAYKLMNNITIPASFKVKIFCNITIDLNGYVLTIEQDTVDTNCISIQNDYYTTTLIIEDSSAAGTGVLRGLITKDGAGRTFIRCNISNGIANHFVLKSGTLEYTAAEGVTPNEKIILFHITAPEAVPGYNIIVNASILGGKVVCSLPNAKLYNEGSVNYGKKPEFFGGMTNLDPSEFLGLGATVTTVIINGETWYQVG